MAILTLLLATTRGCRWLETCQRIVKRNSQCRLSLGLATHVPIPPKRLSSYRQLNERLTAGADSSSQACDSSKIAEAISKGNLPQLKTDGQVEASVCLQQLFGFNAEEVDRWVASEKRFLMISSTDISLNYQASIKAGFTPEVIKEDPGVLAFPHEIFVKKIEFIKVMGIADINDAISFMYLGLTKLRVFGQMLEQESLENGGTNRIKLLSEQLGARTHEVCDIIARHYFMQTILYSRLVVILKIMLDYNVKKQDILNDVWAFRYRPEVIMERFKRVTDARVSRVKPWMIRCSEERLSRKINKEMLRYSVLGDDRTTVDYLSDRLGCEKSRVEDILARYPTLIQISGPKLKMVIDFLLENGFPIEQLLNMPGVLLRKVEMMKKRLEELNKFGHRPTIRVFLKSQREYEDYLNKLKNRVMEKDRKTET